MSILPDNVAQGMVAFVLGMVLSMFIPQLFEALLR